MGEPHQAGVNQPTVSVSEASTRPDYAAASAPVDPRLPSDFTDWFDKLRRGGRATVSEICDTLRSGRDHSIPWPDTTEESPAWQQFSSLRTSLLALLGDIGGDEAVHCIRATAASTRDPLEFALCARALDEQKPGEYRAELIARAKKLLAEHPTDAAPLLQLLALYEVTDAIPDIQRLALQGGELSDAAIAALTLMRRDGGEHALLNLWRRTDLPADTRAQVARALGVAAADSPMARREFERILAAQGADPNVKQEALEGLAGGESYFDARLVPRSKIAWALPHSHWITARLSVLEAVEPSVRGTATAAKLQQVRDELLEELERTQ